MHRINLTSFILLNDKQLHKYLPQDILQPFLGILQEKGFFF